MTLETIALLSDDPLACQRQADTHPPLWDEPWRPKLNHALGHDRSPPVKLTQLQKYKS